MRGRSTTLSHTRTRSVSFAARLVSAFNFNPVGPSLESLPTEILLQIINLAAVAPQYVSSARAHRLGSSLSNNEDQDPVDFKHGSRLDYSTLRALALTSRVLAGLAHTVMYSSVEFQDLKHTVLFARTVVDCAHRDITLSSTTSPISPALPTSTAFSYIPTLFAGKFTNRLALEYPFVDHPRALAPRNKRAELERFYAASGALLGLGESAPSVPSPVLASLRTLVVDSRILEYHLKHSPAAAAATSVVSPAPTELVLHTYIPWSIPSSSFPSISPLAPLGSRLTHLTIACPSAKWTLPSQTLAALGGVPALTHLALVRKANANEENDDEFIRDVSSILSERKGLLRNLVLVVIPDSYSGFQSWKYTYGSHLEPDPDSLDGDGGGDDDDDDDVNAIGPELRLLEAYLDTTYIWTHFAALARSLACSQSAPVPSVCIVPGMTGNAWTRALRKSRKHASIFESNIFHEHGRDLWSWARKFEARRRRKSDRDPDSLSA